MIDFRSEPELADMLEGVEAPAWVLQAAEGAITTDWREAAAWTDSLALAIGRRANRLLRERFGSDSQDRL